MLHRRVRAPGARSARMASMVAVLSLLLATPTVAFAADDAAAPSTTADAASVTGAEAALSAPAPDSAQSPEATEGTDPTMDTPDASEPGGDASTASPVAGEDAARQASDVANEGAAPLAAAQSVLAPDLDNSAPIGIGATPAVAIVKSPTADEIASGAARTFTLTYENTTAQPLANARLWHEYMVGANHTTSYTVSCQSQVNGSAGGVCPAWVPSGPQTIDGGLADQYSVTFGGVTTLQPKQKLVFTVIVTSGFATGVCTENGKAMTGSWARFSRTGFTAADVQAGASAPGALTGAQTCAVGPIAMVNTVKTPRPPTGAPSRVLSGDIRTFTVSWRNTGSTAYTGVPVSYTYLVPLSGQVTEATWTCTANTGSCPAGLASGSVTLQHDGMDDLADTIFATTADFPAGRMYTVTVSLKTAISSCTQDGYVRVQTAAKRGAVGAEMVGRTASSELVEIGCSTWMLEEPFSGTTVADSAWRGLNSACLTRATGAATSGGVLGSCTNRTNSPRTAFQSPVGTAKGYLQFTDDRTDQVGAVLYNRPLPASEGVVVEFTQYQYGNDTTGADGIGFFLADGAYNLTAAGGMGGALGYAYRESGTSSTEQGLSHGYLGLGLDVFGNYVNGSHVAPGCKQTAPQASQSVGLRGSGNGRSDYCLLAQSRVSDSGLRLDKNSAGIPSQTNSSYDDRVRSAIDAAKRKVRVTVYPTANASDHPRVTVEIDFNEGYYRTVLDTTMDQPAPTLIKFGFMGATGGSKQVHLISDVRVGTVMPMKELNLVKAVDYSKVTPAGKTTFDVGDTIPYQFVVHNVTSAAEGETSIFNLQVVDPLISNVDCGGITTLQRLQSVICTGSLVVTEAQRDVGLVRNTATAAGSVSSASGAPRNLTARSAADVAVNPTAGDAQRVIVPGGTATFQVLKSGTTLGLVQPDDPSKITITLIDPATGQPTNATSIAVSGQGTWTIDASNTVTFKPVSASFTGSVTPLQYQASNAYGGTDRGTLSVIISVVPYAVCTAVEQRASERFWGFGTQALVDFGASGASVTTGTLSSVSGGVGTFTVTDSTGALQFVVDPGNGGRIINRTGEEILAGLGTPTAGTAPVGGASQATVFPAGQGTGKYFVVVSTASSTAVGQLRYWVVDMALGNGAGGIASGPTNFGATNSSMAVASVPNADGTGYWVISPDKRAVTSGAATYNYVRAYSFSAAGPINASNPVLSNLGDAVVPATGTIPRSYEDIRFESDLTRFATIASNGSTSTLRLLQLNAATGLVSGAVDTPFRNWTTSNALGYSVEFSPSGDFLYTSSIASSGSNSTVHRRSIGTSLNNTSTQIGTSASNGGAIRLAPEGGTLYWAANGAGSLRYLAAPASAGSSTQWSTLTLATSRTSGYGLSNTLSDCAIPPATFAIEKYASDGTPVDGAAFALYPDAGGTAGANPVTSGVQPAAGTGKFTVGGVAPGKYWVRETKAPAGHALLAQDVLIEVQLRGTVKLDGASNPQAKLVKVGSVYTLRITDTKAIGLPLAGGSGSAALTAAGLGLLVVAVLGTGWWRRRRRPDAPIAAASKGGRP